MVPVQTRKPAALPSLGFTLALCSGPLCPGGSVRPSRQSRHERRRRANTLSAGPQEPRPGGEQRVQDPCSPQPPACEWNQSLEPEARTRRSLGALREETSRLLLQATKITLDGAPVGPRPCWTPARSGFMNAPVLRSLSCPTGPSTGGAAQGGRQPG